MAVCGACGGGEFAPFFRAREWDHTGRYLISAEHRRAGKAIDFVLDYCRGCGLVFQAPGFEVPRNYTEIARDTAKQLPQYASGIIASLREFDVSLQDLILEVGANDGTFLRVLRDTGYTNLLGVEPSQALATAATGSGLAILNEYFDVNSAARVAQTFGRAKAVICRHTLEHVPDIRGMVEGISAVLAAGGLAFIEVPDVDWVVSELFAHELWDEHITYFSPRPLATLLQSAQLWPVRMERQRFRDTRNVLCWAVRGSAPPEVKPESNSDAIDWRQLESFQARWDSFAARLRAVVSAAPRPLIGVGASHIQLNFFNFSGLDDRIELLIDDDPVKSGHFVPLGGSVPICSTAQALDSIRAGTVLRTAFPYPAWEDRICAELAPYGVGCIKPYELK